MEKFTNGPAPQQAAFDALNSNIADLNKMFNGAVWINDCSTIEAVFTAVHGSNGYRIGKARVGSNESSNFKTLVGAPGVGNYGIAFAIEISPNFLLVLASAATVASKVSMKYLVKSPEGSGVFFQTGWTDFAQ